MFYARGEDVCIPKVPIIPSAVTRKYTGLRFPFRVAFVMTVSRAQVQVLILRLNGFIIIIESFYSLWSIGHP
jgi:hypothetical protein